MPKRKEKTIRHSGPGLDDQLAAVEYLSDILDGARQLAMHLDMQVNVLIGVCSAIFLLAVSQLNNNQSSPTFFILAVTSAFAAFASLFALHPPRFMSKRGQQESLMYNKEILSHYTTTDYYHKVEDLLRHRTAVHEQYLLEAYNIYKYYYQPKRWLFHLSRNTLILGVFLSFVAFFLTRVLQS